MAHTRTETGSIALTNAEPASGRGGSRPGATAPRIGVFGRRGSGKTALVRRLAGLPPIPPVPAAGGPVRHRCDLAGLGVATVAESPALEECAVHVPGMGDRIARALAEVDVALLVMDPRAGFGEHEEGLLLAAERSHIPVVGVMSKRDLRPPHEQLVEFLAGRGLPVACVSAWSGEGCPALLSEIAACAERREGVVVLVLPPGGGAEAASGVLGSPVVRDLVTAGQTLVCCRPEELPDVLRRLAPVTPFTIQRSTVDGPR